MTLSPKITDTLNTQSEAFVYVLRTPRALNCYPTTSRPMNVRRAGTQKRFIQANDMHRDDPFDPIARGVMSLIKRCTDRRRLEVDLERVVNSARFEGYSLEYLPESPRFRECIKVTKETTDEHHA